MSADNFNPHNASKDGAIKFIPTGHNLQPFDFFLCAECLMLFWNEFQALDETFLGLFISKILLGVC